MKRKSARESLKLIQILAGRFWGSQNSSIFRIPSKVQSGLIRFWGALAKKVVPEMDPFWGGQMVRNTMNSKGFGDFGLPQRGPFWAPLFPPRPPRI